jgi:hypothetical protein
MHIYTLCTYIHYAHTCLDLHTHMRIHMHAPHPPALHLTPFTTTITTAATAGLKEVSTAVLAGYLPGPMGGQAVAEILGGLVSPSGRLPFTYPKVSERNTHKSVCLSACLSICRSNQPPARSSCCTSCGYACLSMFLCVFLSLYIHICMFYLCV